MLELTHSSTGHVTYLRRLATFSGSTIDSQKQIPLLFQDELFPNNKYFSTYWRNLSGTSRGHSGRTKNLFFRRLVANYNESRRAFELLFTLTDEVRHPLPNHDSCGVGVGPNNLRSHRQISNPETHHTPDTAILINYRHRI